MVLWLIELDSHRERKEENCGSACEETFARQLSTDREGDYIV